MLTKTESTSLDTASENEGKAKAIVIGSGFGGLAAAVRLGARGYQVTVLEQLEQAGGRASVFRQDGFTFDAGPTIITLPFLFEELWSLCGKTLSDYIDLRAMTPFYRLMFADGSHFEASGDETLMRGEVKRLSPQDLEGYEAFFEKSREIYGFAFEDLGDQPFTTLWPMVTAVPGFVKYRADRSVYSMVSKYLKDERLRIAFSFHPLFIGGNPFQVTSMYALVSYLERRYGVHFAMGGTGALVSGLVDLIHGQGGRVKCNQRVDQILVEDGKAVGVRLASGEQIAADVVVSNADSATTYNTLMAGTKRSRWTDKKVEKSHYSMSLFIWYFGTDRRYEDVGHHTIVLGPRYKGLLEDIFTHKVLADDFSMYVYRPTATDPTLAPDGCDAFYALSPVPHLGCEVNWDEMSEIYRQKMEAELERRLLPGLKEAVLTSKIMTPVDFKTRLSSEMGAAFGMEPRLLQSAWFRPHNVSEEVKNLYLVGAGTHPGAGVPGVITSAKILDEVVPHGEMVR